MRFILLTWIGLLGLGAAVVHVGDLTAADLVRPITYQRDVQPILEKNCVACHKPGNIAPMSLNTYEGARAWAMSIRAAVIAKKMPPWVTEKHLGHAREEGTLTAQEIDTIAKWVESGAPDGEARPVRIEKSGGKK
jgi:mono/diheme cytochrome c family protein